MPRRLRAWRNSPLYCRPTTATRGHNDGEENATVHSFETWRNEEAFHTVRSWLKEAAAAAEAAAVRASLETHQREQAERQVYRELAATAASDEQQAVVALYERDRRKVALQSERRDRRHPSEQAQLHRLRIRGRAERHAIATLANPSPLAKNDHEAGPSSMLAYDDSDEDDEEEE